MTPELVRVARTSRAEKMRYNRNEELVIVAHSSRYPTGQMREREIL